MSFLDHRDIVPRGYRGTALKESSARPGQSPQQPTENYDRFRRTLLDSKHDDVFRKILPNIENMGHNAQAIHAAHGGSLPSARKYVEFRKSMPSSLNPYEYRKAMLNIENNVELKQYIANSDKPVATRPEGSDVYGRIVPKMDRHVVHIRNSVASGGVAARSPASMPAIGRPVKVSNALLPARRFVDGRKSLVDNGGGGGAPSPTPRSDALPRKTVEVRRAAGYGEISNTIPRTENVFYGEIDVPARMYVSSREALLNPYNHRQGKSDAPEDDGVVLRRNVDSVLDVPPRKYVDFRNTIHNAGGARGTASRPGSSPHAEPPRKYVDFRPAPIRPVVPNTPNRGELRNTIARTDSDTGRRNIIPSKVDRQQELRETAAAAPDRRLSALPALYGVPLPYKSPRRYVESDVNIHYRVPVRQEPRPLVPEDELARRQADHMRRVYQEERRRKYLQELQDMNSRRHTDNFTAAQKSPISLTRYDACGARVARALHAFQGQSARELSLRRGDLVLLRRRVDANWLEGELDSRVGLFPANYVELLDYDTSIAPSQKRSTEGRARAKFNFVAQTHLELGLRKGELVALLRRVDENWYEGRLGDKKGIFPVSYVEVLAEPIYNRAEQPTSLALGKPVASPAAHSITGSAGAASLGAHRYTPQLNSPALSNSPSSTAPLTLPNHGITSHHARPASATLPRASDHTPVNLNNHEPLYVDTNAEAVPYRAMYKYRPQNPDELELQEGDTVYVLEKCDDGWYVGSSQRTGRFGTFPGNYVEKI